MPYTSNVNFRIAIQESIDEELSQKYDFVHVKISFCNCEEFVTDNLEGKYKFMSSLWNIKENEKFRELYITEYYY